MGGWVGGGRRKRGSGSAVSRKRRECGAAGAGGAGDTGDTGDTGDIYGAPRQTTTPLLNASVFPRIDQETFIEKERERERE